MKRTLNTLIGCTLILVGGLPAWADSTSSPGKSAAYTSLSGVGITTAEAEVATVTILKGKKKRVLEVEGTAIESTNVVTAMGAKAYVNGVPMEPNGTNYQVHETCSASVINCTVTGHWWLDLDAAEAANPGLFINQPLIVSFAALTAGANGTGVVSLRAKLVKK